jgi:hypothetical protein
LEGRTSVVTTKYQPYMAIVTHELLLLRELRFAAPARIKAWKGVLALRSGGVLIELREGESFTVPPFVRFSCLAHPHASRPAAWSLALEQESSADMERAADVSKPWARKLAAAIFTDPAREWDAAHIAEMWGITSARLRASLFAEGESLRSLVREQRVAWVLASLARISSAGCHFSEAGFISTEAMARACRDTIGLPQDIAKHAISLLSQIPAPAFVQTNIAMRRPRYRPYF